MDRAAKTELVDEAVFEVLQRLYEDYDIQFVSDSNYNTGRITIKVKG